jgi:aspartyl aminopeptidase
MLKKNPSETTNLLKFLNNSPTAWHAVANCVYDLKKEGFKELKEDEAWKIKPGGCYYVVRNGSSICAFVVPQKKPLSLRVVASHTDSPSFKLKPNAEFYKENMLMLGLEIYGAPMLASWLNRDLGIAGRVVFSDKKGETHEELVALTDSPVVIPQLAIHLDRNVNESGPVLNKQEHLAALVGVEKKKKGSLSFLERSLQKTLPIKKLLSFDLFLYPLEEARLVGEENHLISAYRIDSLASVNAAMQAFLAASKPDKQIIKMAVFWDNEEIGSHTAQGAGSPFLPHVIERITLSLDLPREDYFQILSRSLCASVDLTHAVHPNYGDKHEPRHLMLLNQGIAIKTNAQHRYASDARSSAAIISLCLKHKIPFQRYAARSDIPCGSTVGPIHANLTGMSTVDIGCSQLSMHSCRELMGTEDHLYLCKLLKAFLE